MGTHTRQRPPHVQVGSLKGHTGTTGTPATCISHMANSETHVASHTTGKDKAGSNQISTSSFSPTFSALSSQNTQTRRSGLASPKKPKVCVSLCLVFLSLSLTNTLFLSHCVCLFSHHSPGGTHHQTEMHE